MVLLETCGLLGDLETRPGTLLCSSPHCCSLYRPHTLLCCCDLWSSICYCHIYSQPGMYAWKNEAWATITVRDWEWGKRLRSFLHSLVQRFWKKCACLLLANQVCFCILVNTVLPDASLCSFICNLQWFRENVWGAFIHLILWCWEILHESVCVNPQRALFNVWMRADCTWVSFLLTNRVVIVWFFFTLHSLAVVLITIAHISRGSCFEIRSFSFSLHLLDMFRLSDTIKRDVGTWTF